MKTEIDEWKDLCAQKDADLRSIYHKLYNDKTGIDKNLDFIEDTKTVQFDSEKPTISTLNGGSDRMKNYIIENKKRIRSRSRNNERKNATNLSGRRKSNLK